MRSRLCLVYIIIICVKLLWDCFSFQKFVYISHHPTMLTEPIEMCEIWSQSDNILWQSLNKRCFSLGNIFIWIRLNCIKCIQELTCRTVYLVETRALTQSHTFQFLVCRSAGAGLFICIRRSGGVIECSVLERERAKTT